MSSALKKAKIHGLKYTDEERERKFWERVDKGDELLSCWEWGGCVDKDGYGFIGVAGKTCKTYRYSWTLRYGDIPKGKHVLHKCDNRKCVNPAHLVMGTPAENSLDMVSKNRQAKGERIRISKLTTADVLEIKRLLSDGLMQTKIAKHFGVANKPSAE